MYITYCEDCGRIMRSALFCETVTHCSICKPGKKKAAQRCSDGAISYIEMRNSELVVVEETPVAITTAAA